MDSRRTALMVLVENGNLEGVQTLADLCPDAVTARTKFGVTAMSLALENEDYDMVRLLIKKGDWSQAYDEWEHFPHKVPHDACLKYGAYACTADHLFRIGADKATDEVIALQVGTHVTRRQWQWNDDE
jgi:hypothetical protein